jgi:hypothetical protein
MAPLIVMLRFAADPGFATLLIDQPIESQASSPPPAQKN